MDLPIHDLYVKPLHGVQRDREQVLPLLHYSDHLLRRFGLAELVSLPSGSSRSPNVQEVADELWALIGGHAQFEWEDQRSDSPTHGARYRLSCDQPTLVLVPFGVAFSVQAFDGVATLVRMATEEDPPIE